MRWLWKPAINTSKHKQANQIWVNETTNAPTNRQNQSPDAMKQNFFPTVFVTWHGQDWYWREHVHCIYLMAS